MSNMPTGFTLTRKTLRDVSQAELDDAAGRLFSMFIEREKEFGFNPGIIVDYPDLTNPAANPFLDDVAGYVDRLVTRLEGDGGPINQIVLLTTFGARLGASLTAANYVEKPIDMPAGPDDTAWYRRNSPGIASGRTLYIEAVDEADPKIRANFALELHDGGGRLRGGACGSIHQRGGLRYAYLATMTLDAGLPPGTGQWLGEALITFMRDEGVSAIHLGTQTAGPFYRNKLGFRITHTILPTLRVRRDADGREITTDLVMMERIL